MEGKARIGNIIRLTRKVIFWCVTICVTLLLIFFLLLQTSFFQNYIAGIALNKLNTLTGHDTKFKNIRIKWFDFVEIKDLELYDYKGDTMIYASTLSVDYKLSELLVDGNLHFDGVAIQDGGLRVRKYPDSLNLNIIQYINVLRELGGKPSDSLKRPPELDFGRIWLNNFTFIYDNQLRDSLPQGFFDHGHFQLKVPEASVHDFVLHGDTIEASIRNLVAKDPVSGMQVDRLQAEFGLSNSGLDLDELLVQTPYSLVKESLHLRFTGMSDLGYFIDSVSFDANLIGSTIGKKDLEYFARIPLKDFSARISTRISGTVPRLTLENLQLSLGDQTLLLGTIDFMGLPKLEETFIDARLRNTHVHPPDIMPFLNSPAENFLALGDFEFTGRFLGFVNDFVANGDFYTAEGFIRSDINLKFPQGWETASYSGGLTLENFNVGSVLNDRKTFQRVNLKGTINGKGLTKENAKFFLNADLHNSGFFGYAFEEIHANGEFASQFFRGELTVTDPNCRIQAQGNIDLGSAPEHIKVESNIDFLDLKSLGFTKDRLELVSHVSADISGLNIDSLQGLVHLTDFGLAWRADSIGLDSVKVSSFINQQRRKIDINLPELDVNLEGDFLFSDVSRDLLQIAQEFGDYFEPDYDKRALAQRKSSYDRYTIDFSVDYQNINRYVHMLHPELYVSVDGRIEGTYYQRENATLTLFTELDSINYKGTGYLNNVVDINFSKDLDSLGIIASAFVNSEKQLWKNIPPTRDLALEAVWFNNRINLSLAAEQPDNNSAVSMNGELKLLKDRLIFSFLPSTIMAFGEQWHFNPYNKIEITNQQAVFDRLEVYQNEQSILLQGTYSDSNQTDLQLRFADFDLAILNTLSPVKLAGIMNSEVQMHKANPETELRLAGTLFLDSLEINEFPVGNIRGESAWDQGKKGLHIDLDVTRRSINTISLEGFYFPEEKTDQLELEATFNGAGLSLLNPFFVGVFSGMQGTADGELAITGSLNRPVLNGSSSVEDGQLTADYLGTTYDLEGRIAFDNGAIIFNSMRLTDKDGDRASLSGRLRHSGLREFHSDLRMAASNFLFLNTSPADNSLYYGTAKMTGDIQITGPFENLLIKAEGTTQRGTKLYIPLSESSEVTQKDYISFVDFSDSLSYVNLEQVVRQSTSGVRIDFDIDVTPDAYVELIFDIRTGDIIRGRGNGNLNLSLDTSGEFELFGDISITEGAYNFTIPNLINKEFSIVPGSTISWYGDPYGGILNLQATYRQIASFADLKNEQGNEQGKDRSPVLVVLDLTGDMLVPVIDFEIKYDEAQGSASMENQFEIHSVNADEQELKKQVFSLLILRKFSPRGSWLAPGGAMESSLSEFLSNQFSYFISQVDENLEVDVDLTSLSGDAWNTFQLRLAYTFLGGRLRVSGGGALPQSTTEQTTNDYLGDWSVRYLLTPDGHLRIKAFSQSEQLAGAQFRETGMSLQYLKSFDDLKELLTKTREEAIQTRPKDMIKEKAANENTGS